jgi:hypothetical protein
LNLILTDTQNYYSYRKCRDAIELIRSIPSGQEGADIMKNNRVDERDQSSTVQNPLW